MEDSKYYVPSLEEFFVGFKYQIYVEGTWYDSIHQQHHSFIDLINIGGTKEEFTLLNKIQSKECRAKLLDSADIESEGWSLVIDYKEELNTYTLGKYQLIIHNQYKITTIKNNNDVIFCGTIYNLSELRKIQQMIGVK